MNGNIFSPAKFQYFWKPLQLWMQFNEEGMIFSDFEKYKNLPVVKGQMFNTKTKVWSVLDAESGKIIDGLESKQEYDYIEKLPEDKELPEN